jgi:hypothetical protein
VTGPGSADPGATDAAPTGATPTGATPTDLALTEGGPTERGPARTAAASARNRLATEVRRVTDLLVGRLIDDDDLDQAAVAVAGVADRLAAAAGPGKRPRAQPDPAGHPQDFFGTSPIVGYANPLAAPVDMWAVRGADGRPELRGRAWFGYAYEGPPTCVHGGIIAEVFDELLGSANILTGRAGMTGTLTVKYRRPTPLLSELSLVARQTRIEGRKIFAWGGIYHDGELTAEAEGIFIDVQPRRFLDIMAANAKDADGVVVDQGLQELIDRGDDPVTGLESPPPA